MARWDDPRLSAGTMVRTALWLVEVVGLGNIFTKEQHRQAFPRVTQADRRLRALRDHGWTIHTSLDDPTLRSDEQRFVKVGSAVWDGAERRAMHGSRVTAKMRMAALAENNYQCTVCGIAGGEAYPELPHLTATLSVSRREFSLPTSGRGVMLVAECKRCRAGAPPPTPDIALLVDAFEKLSPSERSLFARWVQAGRKGEIDKLWSSYRRLSKAAREELRDQVKRSGDL